jgi:uncharacterized protein (DUF4415 family)
MKTVTKLFASSQREKRPSAKQKFMNTNTKDLDRQLKALARLRGAQIDNSDIPELTDSSKGVVGKFYRRVKEPITIRLDADIVAWLKAEGPGYQTRINALLRRTMTPDREDMRKPGRPGNHARRRQAYGSASVRKRKPANR